MSLQHNNSFTNHCEHCERNYECGVLNSAFAILEKHKALKLDSKCREQFEAFSQKLEKYGYSYPHSPAYCRLQHDKNLIRDLVYEAIHMNELFTKCKEDIEALEKGSTECSAC